jgi:hypothetical protein
VIAAGYAFGNYVMVGLILGGLLILFGLFAISALRDVVRPHVAAGATQAGRRLRPADLRDEGRRQRIRWP